MRFSATLNTGLQAISTLNFSLSGLVLSTFTALAFLLPSFLSSGLSSTFFLIRSSPAVCIFMILSIMFFCTTATHLIFNVLHGPLSYNESKKAYEILMNDSMLLQFVVISIGDSNYVGMEIAIWATICFYYCSCKVICVTAKHRLANNQVRNLKKFSFISAFMGLMFMIGSSKFFYSAGWMMILLVNYEGLLVLKENFLILYQLSLNSAIASPTEMGFQLFEIVVNTVRWLHIAIRYSDWILTSPIQFFVIMKVQIFAFEFIDLYRRFRNYIYSMKSFLKKYPVMSKNDLQKYCNEKCCICLESLPSSKCSKISCGHVHHVKCIRTWILNNSNPKCPLCNQEFLKPETKNLTISSFSSFFNYFGNRDNQAEQTSTQIEQILREEIGLFQENLADIIQQ
ncbi:unnamed protein product [Blepharisma stoltei]|uniref:RING-type domain-containing protein n=1 Tax=Blepharisma stoltei TaxID=1481888 RepID=A0AAU9JGX7_9CILI|nr:unnamed protein product [Blepharisma stoltei]